MKLSRSILSVGSAAALSLLLFSGAGAQPRPEVLTNEKIIELYNLGIGEDVVVAKINQSQCRCDTSTTALQRLQAAKIPKGIIIAMLNATAPSSESAKEKNVNGEVMAETQSAASSTEAALRSITEPGIYIYADGKMTYIEPSVFSASKTGGWSSALTYGLKKSKVRAVLRGNSANIQLTNRLPEFYFVFSLEHRNQGAVMGGFYGYAATSPNEFVLLSMRMKDKTREVTLGEFGRGQVQTGVKDSEVRDFSFEKVRPGVYRVVPKNDLAPGEYCFHYAGSAQGTKIFDFGITRSL